MSTMRLRDIERRIGKTPVERLSWIVETVQREEPLTPGDQDNLRLELAAFIAAGNPLPDDYDQHLISFFGPIEEATVHPLPPLEVQHVLARLREILSAVVRQMPYDGARNEWPPRRVWAPLHGRWIEVPPHTLKYTELAARALDKLILECGQYVKACPAPELRATDNTPHGRWFVADRPNQDYCSIRCRSRAATRAFRQGTPTPAMQQAQAREAEQKTIQRNLRKQSKQKRKTHA